MMTYWLTYDRIGLRHARGTPAAATAAKNLWCSSEVEQTGSTQLDQVNYQRGANNIVKVISQNNLEKIFM